mgnify:CR=1 FL=1
MHRGTTPTHMFTLPYAWTDIQEIYITYVQYDEDDKIIATCEKNNSQVVADGYKVSVHLTQEDTLLFRDTVGGKPGNIYLQVRVLTKGNESWASSILKLSVDKILKDGKIEGTVANG